MLANELFCWSFFVRHRSNFKIFSSFPTSSYLHSYSLFPKGLNLVHKAFIGNQSRKSGTHGANFGLAESFTATDSDLYEELRTWRRKTSEELQRPVYTILNNKVLEDIVIRRPSSIEDFKSIKGIGPKTIRYGDHILRIVQKYPVIKFGEYDIIDPEVWATEDTATKPKKVKKISTPKPKSTSSIPKAKTIDVTELSAEQLVAAEKLLSGSNCFISGSAGTGI
jgi:hypothetical protein